MKALPMVTLLLEPETFAGESARVEGAEYRHLFRARRLAIGEPLRVVDGRGAARWAEVIHVDRRHAELRLVGAAPSHEPEHALTLLVAALRPERASWLVEKATELGVVAVRFFASERTPRHYGAGMLERLRRVAHAALEQCHRARLPELSGVHGWEEVARLLSGIDDRWLLDPNPVAGGLRRVGATGVVVIGPEGGLSLDESRELGALGCTAVSLGPRILRVETAALAACARLLV